VQTRSLERVCKLHLCRCHVPECADCAIAIQSVRRCQRQHLCGSRRSHTRHPDFRFKLGGEYRITNPWLFGADLNVIGSQWLIGDQSNQNPKLPAYWVVNLHSSYKVSENIEVSGLVRNLFNQHYAVLGTFFDVNSYPYLNLTDPRTLVPGIP